MIAQIDERIKRALGRIRLAFRGVITLVNAAGAVQLIQADGLMGEQLQENELFQHYGFTSNPPAGTMAIVLPLGGRTAHGIVIATEHGTYRIKGLAGGETALYTQEDGTGSGHHIILKQGRKIEVRGSDIDITASGTLRLAGANVQVHASGTYRFDANGQGQKWDGAGVETWQDDDVVKPHHPHAPPEIG